MFKINELVCLGSHRDLDNPQAYVVLAMYSDGIISKLISKDTYDTLTRLNKLSELDSYSIKLGKDESKSYNFYSLNKFMEELEFIKKHPNAAVILKIRSMEKKRKDKGYVF